MPKTIEHNLIVRIGKSETEVTNNKRLEVLKLTTCSIDNDNRHN